MSWLPGTASTGTPNERRRDAASACCPRRPRWVMSPVTTSSAGSVDDTSERRASIASAPSPAPVWMSDTWISRVGTAEAGYTLIFVSDEATELFDDLYLGVRAGGAMRKQRRGEPLTMEEEAALSRWQRLSRRRKTVAVGAFALGTFGLGFTLGGLVFGRGRKA